MKKDMTDLSPAAQAVLDAFIANWQDEPVAQDRQCLAAALRAVADQAVPEEDVMPFVIPEDGELSLQRRCQRRRTRAALLAIADELEGA